jgi:rhodanese-related sulfurtransferase
MTIKQLLFFILAASLVLFSACSEDSSTEPEQPIDEFALVTEVGDDYVQNYTTPGGSGVNITMDALFTILTDDMTKDDVFMIDYRSSDDYNARHIEGAVNIGLGELMDKVEDGTIPVDKTIINICYTGQNASIATSVLNLLGFDAQNLKFGMCGVTTDTDIVPKSNTWANKVEGSNWYTLDQTDEGDPGATYDFPDPDTGEKTVEAIIKARFNKVWDWNGDGSSDWGIGVSVLPDDVDSYFCINYWSMAEYMDPGHIEGSYQFSPMQDFISTERLNELPTDQKIAVYCYTGQTSAQMTAYLRILGYEAYSITFGVNGFGYDQMIKSTYKAPTGDYTSVLEPSL